tara:strand:+ start:1093 stop:1374 length:282 start_codon:yes stop_codon:yes gene_type:complete
MIKEFKQVWGTPDCTTRFQKGDIVQCLIDPLYLAESRFDCGRHVDEIGIVIDIIFYQDQRLHRQKSVFCELAVYWAKSDMVTYHLDKYIHKIA